MNTYMSLTKRNVKMFFKDKAMFFTSLITPIILLVLYVTFLAKVFKESFYANIPEGFDVPSKLINGFIAGELLSSLLAVSCITVAFCSNLLMVQDKISGAKKDFYTSPVKRSKLALSYFSASFISTFIVIIVGLGASLIYTACVGFYMSFTDVLLIILDCAMLTLLGTAISSIINMFLSTNGQASAVGTIVSAGYGFICGAYMPISSFGAGLRKILMFLPGTYGTSLLRNHALRGALTKMEKIGFPAEALDGIKRGMDCKLSFFGHTVSLGAMYLVLIGFITLSITVYILLNLRHNSSRKSKPSSNK